MGIHVVLHGYGTTVPLKLEFKVLPFVEIYVHRRFDEPFLDDTITFPQTDNENTIVNFLAKELHAAKGDTVAYVNIMMKGDREIRQTT